MVLRKTITGVTRLLAIAWTVGMFSCADEADKGPSINLSVSEISDSDRQLSWSVVKDAEGYQVWRSVKRDGVVGDPVALASFSFLTLDYVDKGVPLAAELQYTVTATVNNQEIKSNIAVSHGASKWLIHPYQMKLIPEKNLAIIRDYTSMFLVDYQEQVIKKKRDFSSKLGAFDLQTINGKMELYVPSSDNNVYILDPLTFDMIDKLTVNYSVQSVAVNARGLMYLSCSDFQKPLKLYDRSTLNLVSQYQGESDSGITLLSDDKLLTVSSHIDPATMSIYNFEGQGNLISRTDDPYNWDYEMDSERLKASSTHIVTSTSGFIYRSDDLTWVKTLPEAGSANYSDFEFSADGAIIYAAVTTSQAIQKHFVNGTQPGVQTISTKGFPWMLARTGDEMIVLSSPTSFSPYMTTNAIILERVKLN